MKRTPLWAVMAAAAVLSFSSCIIAVVDATDPSGLPGRSEFRRIVPFRAGGTLMIENALGNVEVSGWERFDVEVVARPEARSLKPGFYWFGYPGWYEQAPRVSLDRFDDLLKVKTRGDGRAEEAVTCLLNVPMSVNIAALRCREGNVLLSGIYGRASVDLRQGDLRVENYSGSLDVSLGKGKAEVELLDLRPDDEINITVASGDIVILLDKDCSAEVEASTPLGKVTSEFDLGQKLPAAKVRGRLKDGKASISLTAPQGNVEIKKIKD